MKLKSMVLVFVLLLLTVTVCAAQSPMGFSPEEFYEAFAAVNEALEGPDYTYAPGDDAADAYVDFSDDVYFGLLYSANEVNEIYLVFIVQNDDQETWDLVGQLIIETFVTMVNISGEDLDDNDLDELDEQINEMFENGTPVEVCGYYFEIAAEDYDDDHGIGALRVTKSDENA